MAVFLCAVHYLRGGIVNTIILCIHFMCAQIFHFDRAESSQARMQCYLRKTNSFDLEALYQFAAEVKSRCRCSYSSFMLCIYCLVTFFVLFVRFAFDIFW